MKTVKIRMKLLLVATLLIPTLLVSCAATATTQGPPRNRVEVIPVAPSARHFWVPGHYVRRGRNYIWTNGYYRVAPARYSAWVPGFWRQSRRGPVWVEGHWR